MSDKLIKDMTLEEYRDAYRGAEMTEGVKEENPERKKALHRSYIIAENNLSPELFKEIQASAKPDEIFDLGKAFKTLTDASQQQANGAEGNIFTKLLSFLVGRVASTKERFSGNNTPQLMPNAPMAFAASGGNPLIALGAFAADNVNASLASRMERAKQQAKSFIDNSDLKMHLDGDQHMKKVDRARSRAFIDDNGQRTQGHIVSKEFYSGHGTIIANEETLELLRNNKLEKPKNFAENYVSSNQTEMVLDENGKPELDQNGNQKRKELFQGVRASAEDMHEAVANYPEQMAITAAKDAERATDEKYVRAKDLERGSGNIEVHQDESMATNARALKTEVDGDPEKREAARREHLAKWMSLPDSHRPQVAATPVVPKNLSGGWLIGGK